MNILMPGASRVIVFIIALLGCGYLGFHSLNTYRATLFLEQAKEKLPFGQYDLALSDLEAAEHLATGNAEIARQKGKVLYLMAAFRPNQGYAEQVHTAFQRAVDLNSLNALHRNDLGWGYMLTGQYEPAHIAFNEALEADPYNIYYLYSLGTLFERRGDVEAAIQAYQRALDVGNDSRVKARLDHLLKE